MKIYQALYNYCEPEGSFETISIHRSKEGAEKAIENHKKEQYEIWETIYVKDKNERFVFGEFEKWKINETELLE